ncbi:MAG: hypothetical protein KC776_06635 [Myxococcales bacterium]|nr:hypothetical protein [Myxococcales bacterium]MCB9581627.1 hypothetical protein [Polyangiaceae bacterium]
MSNGDDFPACRARSSQDTLAFLDRFRPGAQAEVRGQLSPEVLDIIDSTLPSGWIPIEADAAMGRAVFELLGSEGSRRFWTRFTAHHVESPLLAGPVRAALRLLGTTPASLMKWMPRVFPTVFRNVFDVEVVRLETSSAWLQFRVHSEVFWKEPFYAIVLESVVLGFYEITKVAGSVDVSRNEAQRVLRLNATWGPRGSVPPKRAKTRSQ